MFPYVEQPIFHVFGREIALFQILVCAAVIVGHEVVVRRAAGRGFERDDASSLVAWTILIGFVTSHAFDAALYTPELVRQNPLELFKIWGSMSSFGGMVGGALGGWAVARMRGISGARQLVFLDVVAFAFPFAWIFGRLGCALAHDHPGIATDSWLGVRYPDGPRFDLGLLELLYTALVIVPLFLALDRRPRPTGFFLGLFFVVYSPVRFVLDTLRTGDPRYTALQWTPGQFVCAAGILFGAAILGWVLRAGGASGEPVSSRAPAPTPRPRSGRRR